MITIGRFINDLHLIVQEMITHQENIPWATTRVVYTREGYSIAPIENLPAGASPDQIAAIEVMETTRVMTLDNVSLIDFQPRDITREASVKLRDLVQSESDRQYKNDLILKDKLTDNAVHPSVPCTLDSGLMHAIDHYCSLPDLDLFSKTPCRTVEEIIALDIAGLIKDKAFVCAGSDTAYTVACHEPRAQRLNRRRTLSTDSITAEFIEEYSLSYTSGYFTRLVNLFMEYLQHKGKRITSLDVSETKVHSGLHIPESTEIVSLAYTLVDDTLRVPLRVKQLLVHHCRNIREGLDLRHHYSLESVAYSPRQGIQERLPPQLSNAPMRREKHLHERGPENGASALILGNVYPSDDYWSSRKIRENGASLIDTLLHAGIPEIDAIAIDSLFDELQKCRPAALQSKNVVYHVVDKNGRPLVLKFVANKGEADMEALILSEFPHDPHLRNTVKVPRGYNRVPIPVTVGEATKYLVIQEDVSTANRAFDATLQRGSRRQVYSLLERRLRIAAHIHVYGTQLMEKLGNHQRALRLDKEKDEARILESGILMDSRLRADTLSRGVLYGNELIHQDLRPENIIEPRVLSLDDTIIDWGHAGRGTGLIDVARLLLDHRAQRYGAFGKDEYAYFLRVYLAEKKKLMGLKGEITTQELERVYHDFMGVCVLYAQAQGAYLIQKAHACSPDEAASGQYLRSSVRDLERELILAGRNGPVGCWETSNARTYLLPKPARKRLNERDSLAA